MAPVDRELVALGVMVFVTLVAVLAAIVEMVRRPLGEDGQPDRLPRRHGPQAPGHRHAPPPKPIHLTRS